MIPGDDMSTQTVVLGSVSIATILGAQPFGISIETITIGTAFAIIGVVGRAAFEMQKSSENPGGMPLTHVAGWVASGLIGAPFVTILYLVILKMINVQSDSVSIIGLMFFGFSGPRMLTWLLNTGIGVLNKKAGLSIPTLGQNQDGKSP